MTLKLTAIPRAFHLPQPNWQTIRGWIGDKVPEAEREQAWWDIADDWLKTLMKELGGDYRIEKTDNLLLLTRLDRSQSAVLLRLGEVALAAVIHELGTLAFENWYGPLVVLQFGDGETYYDYIAPFFQEGEFGGSGGICIRSSYVHIALHPATSEQLQAALAHEIAHAAVSHLQMPLWLEEGITQLAEEEAHAPWGRFTLDAQTARELRTFWRERGLADFWWGKGFFLADEGQKFSYLLSQVLFRLLAADHKRSFSDFVRSAHVDDAGESAAQEFLGCGLSDIAAKFLGEGNWAAIPMDGAAYCRRGWLFASQGKVEQALQDLDEGLRIDPKLSEGYAGRGAVHYGLQKYSAAVEDYQKAIQIDPRNTLAHNNLAWGYATCPESAIRNGRAAIEHATKACDLSSYSQWYCLGTLAAAYAEAEEFEEARRWCKESLALAPFEERDACRERLRLYKDGQKCREDGSLQSHWRDRRDDQPPAA